jgi:hypothetical protein
MSCSMVDKASSSLPTTPHHNQNGPPHDVDETPLTQLLSVSKAVLRQALDLVETVLTSDEQLTVHSKYLPGSTIGIFSLDNSSKRTTR